MSTLAQRLTASRSALTHTWNPATDSMGFPAYAERRGQSVAKVSVIQSSTLTGPMYLVRFADGTMTRAFASEVQ